MKKILLLGGSAQQIVAINKAKELGYYTVLCDYLPDNPGQHYCDKFYLASTTDKEAILKIAKEEKIDGIVAYASDPAAPTAAYVAEKLGLPGNSYKSVQILCDKAKFRKFLKDNNFNCPNAKGYSSIEDAKSDIKGGYFKFPIMIKPVDSAGSKGVSKVCDINNIEDKLKYAMDFSMSKNIIVEEYVEACGNQIGGDGLTLDGKFCFCLFGFQNFDSKNLNPYVPYSTIFPNPLPSNVSAKIKSELQRLITLLNIKNSTHNLEIRVDKNENVYLMEVAPRDGGNFIPQVIKYLTNVDLVEASIKFAMGEDFELNPKTPNKFCCYYAIHSYEDGIFDSIEIDNNFAKEHLVEMHISKSKGDKVEKFTGANKSLGLLILKFDSFSEMEDAIKKDNWIRIKLSK